MKDLLKLSGIARSTYYYHIKQQDKDKYAGEKADIVDIFDKNKGIYGYRRITEQLKKKGYSINHKTVLKLMKGLNLRGKQSKNGKYIRRERYSGSMSRSFYVGEGIRQEDIHAKFENGILKLSVPKLEAKQVERNKFISIEG